MVGFFSSTVGTLNQNIKKDDGSEAVLLPYINLAYFAVNRRYQKEVLGEL